MEPLDIVVACTDRKSASAHPLAQVRNLPPRQDGSLNLAEWRRRLDDAVANRRPARQLYQGETWSASLELEKAAGRARGLDNVRLWVLSAGYGLVPADMRLTPYAATFASASPDFVGGRAAGAEGTEHAQAWWEGLCRGSRRVPASPHRVG